MCYLEGQSLRPEMPGHCTENCSLYMSVSVTNEFKKSAYDTMAVNNSDVWKI